jgi:MFS transporter, DHA2 family, multidrug resistance protein
MAIATRLAGKVDVRLFVILGFSIVSWTLWQMTGWSLEMEAKTFAVVGFIQGLGMGMTFMPLNLMAFSTLTANQRTDGASLLNLARSMGGSMGISVIVTLLARSIQTSHADLTGSVTSFNIPSIDLSSIDRFGRVGEAGMRILDGEINRQAAMIAYLNDFQLLFFITVALIPMALFLKPPKIHSGKAQIVHAE